MNVAITHDVTWYGSWIRSGMIYSKDDKTSTKQKGRHFNGQGYGLCSSLVNLIGDSMDLRVRVLTITGR
jgi:hypothetical protein